MQKFYKKLIALGMLLFIIPFFYFPLNSKALNQDNTSFIIQNTDSFVEDFTSTTYRDGGSTDAFGWGMDTLTNNKNLTMTALDFEASLNPIRSIDVQGRKVYAVQYNPASTMESLNVYSINNPSNIYRTGFRSSLQRQMSIAVSGDYLFVGRGPTGPYISTYNYQDPFSIGSHLGNFVIDGTPLDIEINGYLVYFTVFNSISGYSLRVLNAENPSLFNNVMPASWSATNLSKGIAIDGDTAYVAAHTDGFYIVDVSDQNNFVQLGWTDTPGEATDVVIDGTIAYVADGNAGVQIIDISNPASPEIIATHDTSGYTQELVLQGNTLFIADGGGGIVIVDVANPAHPVFIPQMHYLPYTYDVDLYGGVLVVATQLGLYTFSCGPGITRIQNEVFANPFDQFNVLDVRVKDDIAICVGGADGIYTLNVRDPNNPILLDSHIAASPAFYRKLDVQGNFAYVTDYGSGGGIRAYDITDPNNIVQADSIGLNYALDVVLYGDVAIVADGPAGIYIMNITDPYNMVYWCSFTDIFNNVTAVDVQCGNLYVVDENGGLITNSFYVFDITDIDVEVSVGAYSVNAEFFDIFVDGDVAYTSDLERMLPFNITDPTNPYWTTWTNNDSYGVWGFGPFALNAAGQHGVDLVDCTVMTASDPTICSYPNATAALQITTYGDYTYIANTTNLIILRHFESLADTYVAGSSFAQSLEVDSTDYLIYNATLTPDDYIPSLTAINYFMSADGGVHWEAVTPGLLHTFQNPGNDLRFHVEFFGPKYVSPQLYEVNLVYFYNVEPGAPTLTDFGDVVTVTELHITWNASLDDFGIDHYQLQMASDIGFSSIADEYNTPTLSQDITGMANGKYYFRVRSVDVFGLNSDWSNTVEVQIEILVTSSPGIIFPWWAYVIIGCGLVAIILIIVISVVISRKKKTLTR